MCVWKINQNLTILCVCVCVCLSDKHYGLGGNGSSCYEGFLARMKTVCMYMSISGGRDGNVSVGWMLVGKLYLCWGVLIQIWKSRRNTRVTMINYNNVICKEEITCYVICYPGHDTSRTEWFTEHLRHKIYIQSLTHMRACTHTRTHTHTHMNTHAHTHTHTQIHTCTHIYTLYRDINHQTQKQCTEIKFKINKSTK